MVLGLKPDSSVNSKTPAGRTSPSVKSKNFFIRYIDVLNYNSNQSSSSAVADASASTDSVSEHWSAHLISSHHTHCFLPVCLFSMSHWDVSSRVLYWQHFSMMWLLFAVWTLVSLWGGCVSGWAQVVMSTTLSRGAWYATGSSLVNLCHAATTRRESPRPRHDVTWQRPWETSSAAQTSYGLRQQEWAEAGGGQLQRQTRTCTVHEPPHCYTKNIICLIIYLTRNGVH